MAKVSGFEVFGFGLRSSSEVGRNGLIEHKNPFPIGWTSNFRPYATA